ncbi:M1 family metallopeptidase [Kitasatospora sp. CB01950]|uniref:M1 family metallopeptidase n=1 Tax=Kitasatospora sp. CB01950 TaxID=1703930 RepID=UPI00093A350E|nr:M1 family metallopeptidase [Kitasatospora sp. CB01950]OKJ09231.1 peptidase [Kitasatospora sp. CB01950]
MRKRLIVSAASALSLFLAVPASASGFQPGADGVGDPYLPTAGNGGYRVSHYDIRLKYQPTTDELEGTTTILATTTENLSRFNLDFVLKVSEVLVNGRPATFATSGDQELEITPARPLPKGTPVTVVVRYKDVPSAATLYDYSAWHRTPDGGVVSGEPYGSTWWFPNNDHPSNKATYDVSVMVPNGTQVVSNGVLTSTTSQAGWTRFNWRENKPQATYLTTLAIGKFDITQDTSSKGVPIYNAYSKDLGEDAAAARASVERTGELVDWLSDYFGAYPFSSVGGLVPNIPSSGALETQTRIVYGPGLFADGSNTSVVVHELAHQWYGDSVSLSRWSDIWLNEGFAEYAQFLWSEHENEGTAQELADYAYARYPADHVFWTVKPGDPGVDHLFAWPVYLRGAMALQALRNTVGDETFFRILKGWPTERRYGNATVQDFQAFAERLSGRSLADVFTTWLFTLGKPAVGPVPNAAAAATARPSEGALPAEPKSWKKIQDANSVHAGWK